MEPWTRIVNTTINDHLKDTEDNIFRNHKLLAMIKAGSRLMYNCSGRKFDWRVRYKRASVTGYADTDTMSFARINRWTVAELDYRGYNATDSYTKFEELANKAPAAIVPFIAEIAENLMDDLEEEFHLQFYVDGNATGNSKKMHGIESFMGVNGGMANGYVAVADDSYAGLNTDLADKGGSWSQTGANSNWPMGSGDSHYDYWTPLIVDYTDTAWTPTTKTWVNTCVEALRFGISKSKMRRNAKGGTDVILMDDELFRQFKDVYEPTQRIQVVQGKKNGLISLGFGDVIVFDGVELTSEYGVPANVAYGWSMQNLQLRSMQGKLFAADNDYNLADKSKRFSVDFFGNLRFNPRAFTKYAAVT